MSQSRTKADRRSFAVRYWWITLVRGIIALALGMSLLLVPDKAARSFFSFMGMYWLVSGLLSISASTTVARRPGLWLVIGITEIAGGAITLWGSRQVSLLDLPMLITTFSVIAILTGILHVIAGIRIRRQRGRQWSWASFFMGALQIVMGALILASQENIRVGVFHAASIWAFIAGVGFVANALRVRKIAIGEVVE